MSHCYYGLHTLMAPLQMVTSLGICPGMMTAPDFAVGTMSSVLVSHLLRRFFGFCSSALANSPAAGGPHLCRRLRGSSAPRAHDASTIQPLCSDVLCQLRSSCHAPAAATVPFRFAASATVTPSCMIGISPAGPGSMTRLMAANYHPI